MSKIKEFEDALKKDETLRKSFEELIKKYASDGTCTNDGELFIKVAKELGWELPTEELKYEMASAQELGDNELDQLNGGVFNDFDNWGNASDNDNQFLNKFITRLRL